MRPKTITTTKLLAVAAASVVGCSTPIQPAPEQTRTPGAQAQPTATQGAVPLATATLATAAAQPEPPAPPSPEKEDPALAKLRDELLPIKLEDALKEARFKPLCDARGYPLVGNVYRKAPVSTTPSYYCEALRKQRGTL